MGFSFFGLNSSTWPRRSWRAWAAIQPPARSRPHVQPRTTPVPPRAILVTLVLPSYHPLTTLLPCAPLPRRRGRPWRSVWQRVHAPALQFVVFFFFVPFLGVLFSLSLSLSPSLPHRLAAAQALVSRMTADSASCLRLGFGHVRPRVPALLFPRLRAACVIGQHVLP